MELIRPAELAPDATDWTGRWRGDDVWGVLTAARDGDVAGLRAAIEKDPTIVHARYWYAGPLHFAVREGHLDAVRLLADAGASVTEGRGLHGDESLIQVAEDRGHDDVARELRARIGSLPARHAVHDAVRAGEAERVAALLDETPELLERPDESGWRPLHHAVDAGRRELVELLLDRGAEVDAPSAHGSGGLGAETFRPLVLALWHHSYWRRRDDVALARILIDRGARYSATVAAALGDAARLDALLTGDPANANEADTGGKRPLSAAAERGHAAIVRRLLEAGADPNLPEGENCPRGSALWAAAMLGQHEIAEALLAAGANPNADVESSGTPTEAARDEGLRALLYEHGGRVRLTAHVWAGHVDVVAALLDAAPGAFDETATASAFAHAVSAGHDSIVRLLLARGLRVPPVVTSCQTYLWESRELARLLLEHGMDPDLPNWQRMRPLHHLAERGDVETAELFLEQGAALAPVDEEYRSTPLGWAARRGQAGFVRVLLERGALAEEPGEPEWARPLEWARRRGHDEVVALLESA